MTEPLEKTDPELAGLIEWYVNLQSRPQLLSNRAYLSRTLGRNDPCICGSGKKYKKCCIK